MQIMNDYNYKNILKDKIAFCENNCNKKGSGTPVQGIRRV